MIKRELLETITQEEWDTIVGLRNGEARVIAVPKGHSPRCGHPIYNEHGHCAEMICDNYAGRRNNPAVPR